MKKNIFIVGLMCFVLFSCKSTKLKTKVVTVKNVVSYEMFDDDYFAEDMFADNKIICHTVAFTFNRLKSFEDDAFSKEFMNIIHSSSNDVYDRTMEYLNSAKFDEDYFVLFRNGGSEPSDIKLYNDFPFENDGKIIGEYIFVNNIYHSFSYEFIYVSKNHLLQTTIELRRPETSMFEKCGDFFVKEDKDDPFSYYWISDEKKKEFFEILESDNYKKLPKEFQLLREAKDLYLRTLTVLEK